jgi:hypothetical protein
MSKLNLKQMEARDVEWGVPQRRGQGGKEDSGFSAENEEHLLSAFCGPSGHAGFLPPWRDGNDV